MNKLLLGPQGVMPPDIRGSHVRRIGRVWCGIVVSRVINGRCDVDWRDTIDDDWRDTTSVEVSDLCLDLSAPNYLDAGVRALLEMISPGEQPLTAPSWEFDRFLNPNGRWYLSDYCIEAEDDLQYRDYLDDCDAESREPTPYEDGYIICTAAAHETDPRVALSLALLFVAEKIR